MKNLLLIAYILLYFNSFSQNLIPNAGFEHKHECPRGPGELYRAKMWNNPNKATPDFYHTCTPIDSSELKQLGAIPTPYGHVKPYYGDGVAGIVAEESSREYLTVQLVEKLQAGKEYLVTFHVLLSNSAEHALHEIGAHISHDAPASKNSLPFTRLKPQVINTPGNFITKAKGWTKISGTFTARGGEQFLTIGCFSSIPEFIDEQNTERGGFGKAYYFIDNISTVPFLKPKKPLPKVGKRIVYEKILFEFDSWELGKDSKKELYKLYKMMAFYPQLEIKVIGQTDPKGSTSYNKNLSLKRAKVVKEYLIGMGIEKNRIQAVGKGENKEDSPQSRSVDIFVMKK